jgi:transposase
MDALEPRQQRGLMIAAVCKIHQKDGSWLVPSQSNSGHYAVTLDPRPDVPMCTCPDFEERGQPCKHVFAVQYVIQRERNADGSETETVTERLTYQRERVVAKRKTYRQDWPAYNAAQTTEKREFQSLLADVCRGIEEPVQAVGRPRASLRDMAFAAIFKVYSTVSGRRFHCDLDEARLKGHISKTPHYNTVFKYLEMPGLTDVLRRLIEESSLPLRSVETEFAIDSSGFGTSRFVRWFDEKYGQTKRECDWIKVSLMCGVKTNVVTAVEIDEKHAGDAKKFKPLMEATVKNFTVDEVSADAAYLSYQNMNVAVTRGATPYIAFRSNTKAKRGGTFARMFHFYNLKRDEFLAHYHKRSNVESTFSMIKAKFGDGLRSKTNVAMINEALCKIVCHNLCCLIQSTQELGITATFWKQEEAPIERADQEPDILGRIAWM